MLKKTLTVTALAAVLATPAFASDAAKNKMDSAPHGTMQNQTEMQMQKDGALATDVRAQSGFIHSQEANEWRGSELIGASVYGPDGKSIGDINELLIEKEGRVTAVVVGVGGFLGVGEKNVALPLNALTIQRKDGEVEKITVAFTKEQLNGAPTFAYYKGGKAETTGSRVNENTGMPMAPKTDSMKK